MQEDLNVFVDVDAIRNEVVSELSRARDVVLDCLRDDSRCRNDDHWLMLKVWQRQGLVIMIDYQRWKECFSAETIRRVRQDIQSTHNDLPGQFLPTDPMVLIRRKVKEQAIRSFYGTNSWVLSEFRTHKFGIKEARA